MLTEEELVETALLRYAQQRAIKWGSDRFAAELKRRDLEERWVEAARSGTTPYSRPVDEMTPAQPDILSGPVDAAAQSSAVGFDGTDIRLVRPVYERHSSVPRPPTEPEPDRRRPRRRKRDRPPSDPAWLITPAEAKGMSAAGRRLYGLVDPSDRGL